MSSGMGISIGRGIYIGVWVWVLGMVWYQICHVIASLRYSERVIALYRVGITVRYNAITRRYNAAPL